MRTEKQTVTYYQFNELSETVQQTVLDRWRNDPFFEPDFEDFNSICNILGITLSTKSVPLMNGNTRQEPTIYYSGFSSQGDGACFEGSYEYAKGSVKAIKAYAPKDTGLHDIALKFQSVQKNAFYELDATIKHSGHYYHSGCMSVNVERCGRYSDVTDEQVDEITQALRDLADWLYSSLNSEWDYVTSDEYIKENIDANEYEFTDDGAVV